MVEKGDLAAVERDEDAADAEGRVALTASTAASPTALSPLLADEIAAAR
jgi:hypothetical protein